MKYPSWCKTECSECGEEFEITRAEPKETEKKPLCNDCEMYMKGYDDCKENLLNNNPVEDIINYLKKQEEECFKKCIFCQDHNMKLDAIKYQEIENAIKEIRHHISYKINKNT